MMEAYFSMNQKDEPIQLHEAANKPYHILKQ